MTRLLSLVVVLLLLGQTTAEAQALPPTQLRITILEGEGALNNIRQRTAREPSVQVEDENHKPIAGAVIIFSLPTSGPGGTFSGGKTVFNAKTDASGHASAKGLKANDTEGNFQIQITAMYGGLTAHASINQSNFKDSASAATVAPHAFPLKTVLIVAAAAAGAAVIAIVATHSGSNSGVVIPGTPAVGP